ncbi:MAG TPA: FG-GAP repeat protein, partial [Friedmanniella sp.]
MVGSSRSGDRFGSAVASGDFDGDGYADLAVGHPGERVAGASQAGAVTVLFGTRHGLTGSRSVQL